MDAARWVGWRSRNGGTRALREHGSRHGVQIRLASHEDVAEIETVMRDSLEVLGRSAYGEN